MMPQRPKRHSAKRKPKQERRPNFRQRGYSAKWDKFRKRFLRDNPLCVHCKDRGIIEPAVVCDHIIPHRGNMEVFWRDGNHQSLCLSCHSKKTARGE